MALTTSGRVLRMKEEPCTLPFRKLARWRLPLSIIGRDKRWLVLALFMSFLRQARVCGWPLPGIPVPFECPETTGAISKSVLPPKLIPLLEFPNLRLDFALFGTPLGLGPRSILAHVHAVPLVSVLDLPGVLCILPLAIHLEFFRACGRRHPTIVVLLANKDFDVVGITKLVFQFLVLIYMLPGSGKRGSVFLKH